MNSSYVDIESISPNKNSPRNHAIDSITIHCTAGQMNAKDLLSMFAKSSRKASANYVIGKDCLIGLCVPESDRSWCSSSAANDNRSITIEVSSDSKSPYNVNDDVFESLLVLLCDICRRNGFKRLVWLGDDKNNANYERKPGECLLTLHKWFANKACPGPYLIAKMPVIAEYVNTSLNGSIKKVIEKRKAVIENLKTLLNEMDQLNQIVDKYFGISV